MPLLLVDSEGPTVLDGVWRHLLLRDDWRRPSGATGHHAFLMVQCMETWFLADVSWLKRFFGAGFRDAAIKKRSDIEDIPKRTVFRSLERATADCRTKGRYLKGAHSFQLPRGLDPQAVLRKSPHARRLVDTIRRESHP